MFELIEDRSLIVPIGEPVTSDQRRAAFDLFGKFGKSMRQIQSIVGFKFVATVETIIWEEMQARQRHAVNRAMERGRLLAMPNLPDPGAASRRPVCIGVTDLNGRKAA